MRPMRKSVFPFLITAALVAASWQSSAQLSSTGAGKKASPGGGGFTASCTESSNFIARTSGLDNTHKTRYDTLICGLVTDSVFTLLDGLWVFATDTESNAQLNLISSSFNLTKTGSPTFTANTGYTGDASAAFLDTGLNPSVVQASQNSSSVGAYVLNSRATGQAWTDVGVIDLGASSATEVFLNFTGNLLFAVVNDGMYNSISNSQAQGSWILTRTTSTLVTVYRNGSSFGTSTATSVSRPNGTVYVLGRHNTSVGLDQPTGDQLSMAFVGRAMNATQAGNFQTRINTYMTSYGINVY